MGRLFSGIIKRSGPLFSYGVLIDILGIFSSTIKVAYDIIDVKTGLVQMPLISNYQLVDGLTDRK